ncbi:sulfurtransferase [Oceanobacillus manasiensis]|uniref:sulfurtransferase n=1 Tax=Oceanobacillus manasiensis TaxID=586413 RepID=UPI0005A8E904|nr:sulfurtransferase [Oceanobacillus manasiensis]
MSYIISVERLKKRLENENNKDNTVIVDVRFQLTDSEAGRKQYIKDHLPGAVYLDLEKDLSSKPEKHGGKHPLPDMTAFSRKLGKIGIDHETTVVIYDQENEMFASRLWWLLHSLGHQRSYVLDGGYNEWVRQGNDITDQMPELDSKLFRPIILEGQTANIEEVREKLENDTAILIDSRERERYLGNKEPLYHKAGHIPGAKNYFWKNVLNSKGAWKKDIELKDQFSNLSKDTQIIVSCGSGISACPNVLALKMAGYENVKLYPGSFSDWISYDENEIETKEE